MPNQNVTPDTHTHIPLPGIGVIAVPNHILSNPDSLDALSRAIVSHPDYKNPNAPEISESDVTPGIDKVLATEAPKLTAEGAMENQQDFIDHARNAWVASGAGQQAFKEAGFTVSRKGELSKISQNQDESQPNLAQDINDDTMALIHTHPGNAGAEPSPHDVAVAKQTKKPVMVISRGGLYEVAPGTGKITKVKDGLDWMNEKKKKS